MDISHRIITSSLRPGCKRQMKDFSGMLRTLYTVARVIRLFDLATCFKTALYSCTRQEARERHFTLYTRITDTSLDSRPQEEKRNKLFAAWVEATLIQACRCRKGNRNYQSMQLIIVKYNLQRTSQAFVSVQVFSHMQLCKALVIGYKIWNNGLQVIKVESNSFVLWPIAARGTGCNNYNCYWTNYR